MRIAAVVLIGAVLLAGCSDDADDAAAPETVTTVTTTTTAEVTTTSAGDGDGDDGGGDDPVIEPVCPDDAPVPAGAEEQIIAPVSFDGDGDGIEDILSAYLYEDSWWIHVVWGAGGSTAMIIDDVSMAFRIRPLGGHDLGDHGRDVAFVAMGGPASGSIIGLFVADGCEIGPVIDIGSGGPFNFPVTASIGTFSGATCNGLGDIDLFSGELVDPDIGEYLVAQAPYTFQDGQVTAEFGDAGSVGFDDVGGYATLDCGELSNVW